MATPLRLTVRSPVDLIALAHVGVGFVPEESLVISALGGRQFHCRLDLVAGGVERDYLQRIASIAHQHGTEAVAVVIFTERRSAARRVAREVLKSFHRAGLGVMDVVQTDGSQWLLPLEGPPTEPRTCDLSAHPLMVASLEAGHPVLASRAALAAKVATDPDLAESVATRLSELSPESLAVARAAPGDLVAGESLPADEIAAVLVRLESGLPADWVAEITAENAAQRAAWWCAVTRGAPPGRVADPAAVAALASWTSGNGALAQCAVDRCLGEEPGHRMGNWVQTLLVAAAAPAPSGPAVPLGGPDPWDPRVVGAVGAR